MAGHPRGVQPFYEQRKRIVLMRETPRKSFVLAQQEIREHRIAIELRAQHDGVAEQSRASAIPEMRPAACDETGQDVALAAIAVQEKAPTGCEHVKRRNTEAARELFNAVNDPVFDVEPELSAAALRMHWPLMVRWQIEDRRSCLQLLPPESKVRLSLWAGQHLTLPVHKIAVLNFSGQERVGLPGPRGTIEFQKLGKDETHRQPIASQMVSRNQQQVTLRLIGEQMRAKQRAGRQIERVPKRSCDGGIGFVR